MKKKETRKRRDFSGSTFDSFLEEHGIREEVEAVATKRVLAWQLEQEMKRQRKTKQAMAQELQTSRSQLDRLLDPRNTAVTLDTINRAAKALGMKVVLRVSNQRSARRPGCGSGIPMRSRFASGSRISISYPQGASSTSARRSTQ